MARDRTSPISPSPPPPARPGVTSHAPLPSASEWFFRRPDAAEAVHLFIMELSGLTLTDSERARFTGLRRAIPQEVLTALERSDAFRFSVDIFTGVGRVQGQAVLRDHLVRDDARRLLFFLAKGEVEGLTDGEEVEKARLFRQVVEVRRLPPIPGDGSDGYDRTA